MSKWQTLANLSVPQKGNTEKQTDLVMAGETIEMTDAEAERINRRHRVPVLRPAKDQNLQMPGYVGRQGIVGRALYNTPPSAAASGMRGVPARPDPDGSSAIGTLILDEVLEPAGTFSGQRRSPEMNEPQPGTEESAALDLPPRRRG